MRKRILVLAIVLLASITLWAGTGDRHALVIGNGKYQKTTPLANPPTDATDVAKLLEDVGFMVTLQTDASLSQMEGTIREFANEAKKASAGTTLFYYAGHGVQFEGTNYLLPVDADIHKDYELRSKAVSMELVSSALNETDSDFNLILLDACRDNPFASSRGGARGLMPMGGGNPESMVVFSTSPGSVAQDGDGSNSPFTTALKQHLLTPDQEVRQLVASVSKSVQTMTKGRQIPWVNTSFTGSFYFVTAEQQLMKADADARRLKDELAALESEIAKRQAAILAETDSHALQQLQLEQQRAKALEISKKLEVQRMEQIREQAAYQLAVQAKELAEKRALEATVVGQQEELARQAEKRRAELTELERQKSLSSDALQRLDLIAKMEKAITDIEGSFALSITGTIEELERLGLEQVGSYRTTNPQDPWETGKEFEARVAKYQAGLVAEGEAKIREIEKQRDGEVEKIRVQLAQAKRELESMQFTLGPAMTKVTVEKFDAANKRFPIKVVSTDSSFPFECSLFHTIAATERDAIQREYLRVDSADKAQALVGTIRYSLEEFSPGIWRADATSVEVKTLLEGTPASPGLIARKEGSRDVTANTIPFVISDGTMTRLYGLLPIQSNQGPVLVYSEGRLLGKADAANSVYLTAKTSQDAKAKGITFELVSSKKRNTVSLEIEEGINDVYFPRFVYQVGEAGPAGGYVFYDKGSYSEGWRYLEAAPAAYEYNGKVWGGYGTTVGGTGTAIGTGKLNTEKIVSKFGNAEPSRNKTDYAAKLCFDLVVTKDGVAYDDWFLPSKDELNKMYQNLKRKNIGGFSDNYYWSSSENVAPYAWYQDFNYGGQANVYRDFNNMVRPVRAF